MYQYYYKVLLKFQMECDKFCTTLLIHQVKCYSSNSKYYEFQVTSFIIASD